jgi:hypothetical protein
MVYNLKVYEDDNKVYVEHACVLHLYFVVGNNTVKSRLMANLRSVRRRK